MLADDIKFNLIYRIKHEMLKQGLTQEMVGERLDLSRSYISLVLQGKASLEKLLYILEGLGKSVKLVDND